MQPTFLPLAVKASAMGIEDGLPGYLMAQPPSLATALFLCERYRRMAVGFLLMEGMPGTFFELLFKSGRCFLHFLEHNDDAPKVTSRADPFFDSIACNDIQGANLIAARSRLTWNQSKEYEDDFLYVLFLIQRFFQRADRAALTAIIDRYEEVLEGARDFKLNLCKALLDADQKGFDAAVEAFIAAAEKRADSLRARDALNPDEAATTVHVSTELLAWLRLAGEVGLKTQPSYPMAPEPARLLAWARFPAPDAWKVIESYRDLRRK